MERGEMGRWPKRLVCRFFSHDWWALAYPPARRWECHRCGAMVEEPARPGTGFIAPPAGAVPTAVDGGGRDKRKSPDAY
jgi:hypothetical protein